MAARAKVTPIKKTIPAPPNNTDIYSEMVLITPEIAEAWLAKNTHNRPLRNQTFFALAAAITRGEWKFNGDAIRFSKTDVLLDGQHRLWAIVESGITCESMVIWNLEDEVQETMDMGKRRSLKDVLALRGYPNASWLASVLNYKWRYDLGEVRNFSVRPTIPQALDLLKQNPELRAMLGYLNPIRERFRLSSAMLGTCLYEFFTLDAEDMVMFAEKLKSGESLDAGSPILALRRYLERTSMEMGSQTTAMISHALFIKAWNAWRDGRQIERVTWKGNVEAFPTPH